MLKHCFQIIHKKQNHLSNIIVRLSSTSNISGNEYIEPDYEGIPKRNHCFKDIFPWKNNRELVKHIVDNAIVYNNESLVAINKPYGLGNKGRSNKGNYKPVKIVQTLNTSLCSTYDGNLAEILPLLAQELGVKQLTVLRTPERYNSGITLLSTNDDTTEKVKQCFLRVFSAKALLEDYLAVTIGTPTQEAMTYLASIYKKASDKTSANKQAILVEKLPKSAVENKQGKLINVHHETLYTNKKTLSSLVKICPSSTTWHFIRVYMSCLLSPILGDNVHGSRVTFNSSGPKAINPMSHLAQSPQRIPPQILDLLQLKNKEEILVPVHLHLSKLCIPGFFKKTDDLIITAPVPEHFKFTCEKLELVLPADCA